MQGRSDSDPYQAVILDLDGVITQTARLHARAWKQMFDAYLRERGERTFDVESDYKQYIDGKPRYDGVRGFLQSRGIELPEGEPEDEPGGETICGLGNRKNDIFQELLRSDGVEIYEDAVEQVRRWKQHGLKTAVVSSSRNCQLILQSTGLTDLFEVRVDGVIAAKLGLAGKPNPDIFLEAAHRLDVEPSRAVVVEDALAGVQAGQAGHFGLVVGVVRHGDPQALQQSGADLVVSELTELTLVPRDPPRGRPKKSPHSVLDHLDWLECRLRKKRPVVFLDYDGTLTPIVERPEMAKLSPSMQSLLKDLASRTTVAVISGRDLANVRELVGLDELIYAGSHGFDIAGPAGLRMQHEAAQAALPDLDAAERALCDGLDSVPGCEVERKKFAIAVHDRRVPDERVEEVESVVTDVQRRHPRLRKRGGKKIFELQPDVAWDKGRAVLWLLTTLDLDKVAVVPIYLGDDLTDEDAFSALTDRGIGIRVGNAATGTHAAYFLRDTEEVERFLQSLKQWIDAGQ